jgi:hypothetical protein
MAGDGVSIQTTITQLGNLAKAQSRSQQSGTTAPGQAQELAKEDVAPLQKVRETDKSEKKGVDPDQERKRRRRPDDPEAAAAEDDDQDLDDPETRDPRLGNLVDTKA